MSVGIDEISFNSSSRYLDLRTLAKVQGTDPDKYYVGIGQEKMAMAAPDEDIVTMAANAALPLIENQGQDAVSTLLLATESGIDQSKSAGVYVHHLLGLNPNCRVVELKQACFGATAALQMACGLVARNPQQKVLVIASDIARYDLNTPGEATQGCGACAMIVSANPRLVELDAEVGSYTEDVMDFWRPNYRTTALVDGKLSTMVYLRALKRSWKNFTDVSPVKFTDLSYFCYHMPFSRMAQKAHQHLARINKSALSPDEIEAQLTPSQHYNRILGNSYTASIYIALSCLLDNADIDLANKRIGFFSYGSGSVAEFFTGRVMPGYRKALHTDRHAALLEDREEVDYDEYLRLYHYPNPTDGSAVELPHETRGRFRLAAIRDHKREYVAL